MIVSGSRSRISCAAYNRDHETGGLQRSPDQTTQQSPLGIIAGAALTVESSADGHELSADVPADDRLGVAFTELARCL
jgi:hypothetical protein